jgi:hypothetical protein
MSNPNIVNVTTIYGNTEVQSVTTTPTAIVTNTAASGKILKINSLTVSNIDGSNAASISVEIYRSSSSYYMAKTIPIAANASLVVICKDNGVYLLEGDSIRCTASADGDLQAVCSYEEIS